jgi:predicted esterase
MPPDVAEDPAVAFPPVLIGRGTRDGWYTEARMARDVEVLEGRGARLEAVVFEGGHEWGEPFRRAAGGFLGRISAA